MYFPISGPGLSFAYSGRLVLHDWLRCRFSKVFPLFVFSLFWYVFRKAQIYSVTFPGFSSLFHISSLVVLKIKCCFLPKVKFAFLFLSTIEYFTQIWNIDKKNVIIFRKSKYFQSFNRKVVDYSENGTDSNISVKFSCFQHIFLTCKFYIIFPF